MQINYNKLIIEIKNNNQKAFDNLYKGTVKLLFSIVYPIVQNKEATEDIIQDTYMKAMNRLDTYNSKYKFSSWIGQIAKNLAIDYQRKQQSEMNKLNKLINEPPEKADVSESFNWDLHLSRLDAVEYQIITLKFTAKLTFIEIAKMIDKPVTTTFSIYRKALKILKNSIERSDIDE